MGLVSRDPFNCNAKSFNNEVLQSPDVFNNSLFQVKLTALELGHIDFRENALNFATTSGVNTSASQEET